MKIIITTMTGENYGSALQSYSLQKAFMKYGAQVNTISLTRRRKIKRYIKLILNITRKNPSLALKKIKADAFSREKKRKINLFYNKNIDLVYIDSPEEMKGISGDAYVCGSDQIWNPQFQPNSLFYLDFTIPRDIKKYSYACSLAVDTIDQKAEKYFNKKLLDFSEISVRECTGKYILEDIFKNREIRNDVDPVLLHDKKFWETLNSGYFKGRNYIFLYMLRPSPKLIEVTEKIATILNLPVYYVGDYYYQSEHIKYMADIGVEDFLDGIKNARFVITNSFHATVFSVLFETDFISDVIERTGSRVNDFLKVCGLEDRILDKENYQHKILEKVDFSNSRNIIAKKREESLIYIKRIVETNEVCKL